MKKFAKMSLVAAVAVAGLSSYSSASSLEEAIKGVEINGYVRYRLTSTNLDQKNYKSGTSDTDTNQYDIKVTTKIPVNDMVQAVVKFQLQNKTTSSDNSDDKTGSKFRYEYFQFNLPYITVMAGKQSIPSPFVDDEFGTGFVAVVPAGPVSFTASYFNSTSLGSGDIKSANGEDVYQAGVLGSFDPVSFEAWYMNVKNTASAYNASASATLEPVTVSASYAILDPDEKVLTNKDDDDYSTVKVQAKADLDFVALNAGWAKTGENGSAGALDKSENDPAVNDFGGEIVDLSSANDFSLWTVGASVSPMEKVTLGAEYFNGSSDEKSKEDDDYNEIKASASYKVSKNFKISSFYSVGKNGTEENDSKSRLELKYTF